jgi:16S rRNA G966 N2-methylase RsmD
VYPALKYSSIDFMESSIDVTICIDSFSFSSATSFFAFCSSFLGSLILELNTSFIKVALQNLADSNALS